MREGHTNYWSPTNPLFMQPFRFPTSTIARRSHCKSAWDSNVNQPINMLI
ncbi:hypothetical protein [Azospirillum doebereinerae]